MGKDLTLDSGSSESSVGRAVKSLGDIVGKPFAVIGERIRSDDTLTERQENFLLRASKKSDIEILTDVTGNYSYIPVNAITKQSAEKLEVIAKDTIDQAARLRSGKSLLGNLVNAKPYFNRAERTLVFSEKLLSKRSTGLDDSQLLFNLEKSGVIKTENSGNNIVISDIDVDKLTSLVGRSG